MSASRSRTTVRCPASCDALVIAVPIAPAPPVTTAIRPRSESSALVMVSYRSRRIVWPWCNGVQLAQRLVIERDAFGGQVLPQVSDRSRPRDEEHIGGQLQKPLECGLRWRDTEAGGRLDDYLAGEHGVLLALLRPTPAMRSSSRAATMAASRSSKRASTRPSPGRRRLTQLAGRPASCEGCFRCPHTAGPDRRTGGRHRHRLAGQRPC